MLYSSYVISTQSSVATLHGTTSPLRALLVLLLGSTLEIWPWASGTSLCVCTERETQGTRGLGEGPWGAH